MQQPRQPTHQPADARGQQRGSRKTGPSCPVKENTPDEQKVTALALPSPDVQICGPWAMLQPPKQASPILMCNQLH